MFPMEFDHTVLDSLPLPGEEDTRRLLKILKAICNARIFPYFRSNRGTHATVVARVADRFAIHRMEDGENLIRPVSLLFQKDDHWTIQVHERIFDYLAFVIPSDPESRLGGTTSEEGKVLAFAEFFLRHQIEHMLYPSETEREVIGSDVSYAMEKREDDPTFYRGLRAVLVDEMTGLKGAPYLALFDAAEYERPYEYLITQILTAHITHLCQVPDTQLQALFPLLDQDVKGKILSEYYRRSQEPSDSLTRRSAYLQGMARLFSVAVDHDEKEAETIFRDFKGRWGLIYLFHELDLPETVLEEKDEEEIFDFIRGELKRLSGEAAPGPTAAPAAPTAAAPEAEPAPTKSLKDRIEEARHLPDFSRQALAVIDKNKTSAVGHSGPKYTELIETLLAVPWGRIEKIAVTPEAFESGLERSHYGLRKPKEIVCDFFTNLIWRYDTLQEEGQSLEQAGSAFLFVGPPGVGKTSLAISIAQNLGIPYHKISLGGMRDEADLRGHGFTYEGSKPGAIVQGLIKMGIMNGMFIMDEADKTEKFAIATLLEILDPEQNHLFHDKYTATTVDIDLSNCQFILTANTLETVPPPVVNRCEVVMLDRYSVDEKVAIAQQHLIRRIRQRYRIAEEEIDFSSGQEADLLRYLIKSYTYEAGVRELERIIRTLFLRLFRKEILAKNMRSVRIDREKIKQYLETPRRPSRINDEDRVGEALALGVNVERGIGSIIPVQATRIQVGGESGHRPEGYLSMVHATGNIEKIMDESRRVATTGILHCAEELGIELERVKSTIHLHFMGSSTPKDGPSAGGAIALALASVLSGRQVRRDVAMTGEIDTHGRILAVGGLDVKLETACDAECKTMIIPTGNLLGDEGIERLPEALKQEIQILNYGDWKGDHAPFDYERHMLQVVAVDHITEAADIAFMDQKELDALRDRFVPHARSVAGMLRTDRKGTDGFCSVFYPKAPKELEAEICDASFWGSCRPCLVVGPEMKKDLLECFQGLDRQVQIWEYSPSTDKLSNIVEKIRKTLSKDSGSPAQITLVAPFYFLMRSDLRAEELPSFSDSNGLRLFANNYAAQHIKMKGCRAVLNRVFCYLSQLKSTDIESCPFLTKLKGIYTVDLSFIPEKYRLDVQRSERILNGCLNQWLEEVEKAHKKDNT